MKGKKVMIMGFLMVIALVTAAFPATSILVTENKEESTTNTLSTQKDITNVAFYENFESTFPGSKWAVWDTNSGNDYDYWGTTTYRKYAGSKSAWCAEVGVHGSNIPNNQTHTYDGNMDAYMKIQQTFNTTFWSSGYISFMYWADVAVIDYFYICLSNDNGTTWVRYLVTPLPYTWANWNFSLPQSYLNISSLTIAFEFVSAIYLLPPTNEGVYIDELYVNYTSSVHVDSPNGGETWYVGGCNYSINWTIQGGTPPYNVTIYFVDYNTLPYIIGNVTQFAMGSSNFIWNISPIQPPTLFGKVRIVAKDSTGTELSDESNNFFVLAMPPSLSVQLSVIPQDYNWGDMGDVKVKVTAPDNHPIRGAGVTFYLDMIVQYGAQLPPIPPYPFGTDSMGEASTLFTAPLLVNGTMSISAVATFGTALPGVSQTVQVSVHPPDFNRPYRVIIIDPERDFSVMMVKYGMKYVLGKGRTNPFWDYMRNYTDVTYIRCAPRDNLSKIVANFPPDKPPTAIILSDLLFKFWELNKTDNFETVKTLAKEYGTGIILTHGTFFDIGLPTGEEKSDTLIGASQHWGLYKDDENYTVDLFKEGTWDADLATFTGFGLMPIYEYIKITVANMIESENFRLSHLEKENEAIIVRKIVASVIRNTPLSIPYVKFNGTMDVLEPAHPILEGIPLSSSNTYTLDINSPFNGILEPSNDIYSNFTGKANYTQIGWQLEYPELIVDWALAGCEQLINTTWILFENMSANYNSIVDFLKNVSLYKNLSFNLSEIPYIDSFNSTFIKYALINGIELLRCVFKGILNARSELPYINITLPSINITYPDFGNNTTKNITLPPLNLSFVLPAEVADWVVAILKPPKIIAISSDKKAAVLAYTGTRNKAVYFTYKPESTPNLVNTKMMYNAIKWVSIPPPKLKTIPEIIYEFIINSTSQVQQGYLQMQRWYTNYSNLTNESWFVTENGTSMLSFQLSTNTSFAVTLVHGTTANASFELISPSGKRYSSSHGFGGCEYFNISLSESEIGRWCVEIKLVSTKQVSCLYAHELFFFEVKGGSSITIIHNPVTNVEVGQSINLSAHVVGTKNITGVWVYYKPTNENVWYGISMSRVSGDAMDGIYNATLPPQTTPGVLEYYIFAIDEIMTNTSTQNYSVVVQPVSELSSAGIIFLSFLLISAYFQNSKTKKRNFGNSITFKR